MAIDRLAQIDSEVGVTVAGDDLDASVSDFYRRCLLMIRHEQRQPSPNIALITLLSDAVCFTREHCYLVGRYLYGGAGFGYHCEPQTALLGGPSSPARDGETLSDEQLTAIGYRAGIRLSDSVDELERAAAQDTLNAVKIARALRDEVARLRARSEESE